jgi:FMN phosphatase YigB (HAD superfamily)
MIHHLSIAAHNPKQVADVLAELFQGEAFPFPDARYSESYVALSFDAYGTVVDVHPFTTELIPGAESDKLFQHRQNFDASPYTATHAAISVPINEAQIKAIATRENWQMRHRKGLFEVIELWIENRVLIELLPPAIVPSYLDFMETQKLKQFFAAKAAST